MSTKPSFEGLRNRIQKDIDHFVGVLPENYTLVWDGYLAALAEWDLISIGEHARLSDMLPKIENNPVITLMIGRPNDFVSD